MSRTSPPPADPPDPGWAAGPDARVTPAPAKVNLFLEVLGKRPDGFHEVATLLLAVDLFDTLEVRPTATGRLALECHPPGLPTGPDNLVWRAAAALQAAAGPHLGAAVRLTKRIPAEAGLGGGSSDAAAALAALNAVWRLGLTRAELTAVAAAVGSDVGFFLSPPAAWCTGRGEVVEPVAAGGPFHLVVVKPPDGCPTADVYRRVAVPGRPADGAEARAAVAAGDPERLGRAVFNRLQPAAFGLRPGVAEAFARLAGCRPLAAALSGSGSAVFAVCRDRADADRAARQYTDNPPPGRAADRVFVVRSLVGRT